LAEEKEEVKPEEDAELLAEVLKARRSRQRKKAAQSVKKVA